MTFQVGDRIRTVSDPSIISSDFMNLVGTIVATKGDHFRVAFEDRSSNSADKTWSLSEPMMILEEPEPSDAEVARLFGLAPPVDHAKFIRTLSTDKRISMTVRSEIDQYLRENT